MTQNDYSKSIDSILTEQMLLQEVRDLQHIYAIAKKYDLHPSTVARKLKKFGITVEKTLYRCNEEFFSHETEEAFYLAGFIAADGCVSENGSKQMTLTIVVASLDREHIFHLRSFLGAEHPVFKNIANNSKRNPKWKDTINYGFRISSDRICDDLAKFNIVPRKTKIYTFPKWLIDHPLVHHFMRGYNDGDGCIRIKESYRSGKLDFQLVGQPQFLEIYKQILEKQCDIANPDKIIQIKKNGLGSLQYCGNRIVIKIAEFLYNDATIFLPRKYGPIQIQRIKLLDA
jgi:hypothetical protein